MIRAGALINLTPFPPQQFTSGTQAKTVTNGDRMFAEVEYRDIQSY